MGRESTALDLIKEHILNGDGVLLSADEIDQVRGHISTHYTTPLHPYTTTQLHHYTPTLHLYTPTPLPYITTPLHHCTTRSL